MPKLRYALLLLAMLSGCEMPVSYTPSEGKESRTKVALGSTPLLVNVRVFDDRPSPDIGVWRGSKSFGTFTPKPDVGFTLGNAIESELASRGFTIEPDGARVVARMQLLNVYWVQNGRAEARLDLEVDVQGSKSHTQLYEETVTGYAGIQGHFLENNLGLAASAALSDAVTKLFADQNFVDSVVLAAKGTGAE